MNLDRFQNAESPIDEEVHEECMCCGREILVGVDETSCSECGHNGCVMCVKLDKDTLEYFCGKECKQEWLEKNGGLE